MDKLLYKVKVTGQKVMVTERLGSLISNMRGFSLRVTFGEDWATLRKTAVFQAADHAVSVPDITDEVPIPTEVLTNAGHQLKFGIFGENDTGKLVVPTTWVTLDTILPGADPSAQEGYEPLPDLWQQIRYQIGDLRKLSTTEKASLVAAINALAASKDPGDHRALTNRNAEGQHTMDAITGLQDALSNRLLASELGSAINQALSAAAKSGMFKGEPGEPGLPGASGHTPVKGTDYFTPTEVEQIAAEAAEKVTGFLPAGGPVDFTDDGKGIAFGTTATREGFECAMPARFTGGVVMEWLGFDPDTGNITDTFQADLEAVFSRMKKYSCLQVQFVDPLLNNQKHMGTLWKYTYNYGFLTADNYSGVKAIKTYYGGEWLPWEWEDPPMKPDVEYRTTERHNGKVVYTKLVSFGALPNATEKIVTCMPKNANMIEAVGYASGATYNMLIPGYKAIESMGSNRSSGTLWISTTSNMSGYEAWITIKYTK